MPKITKSVVDRTDPGARDVWIWDDMPGFALRVSPSGTKSYVVQYRDENRRTRRVTLGRHGVLTPDQARKRARELLGEVAGGGNPAERKKTAQEHTEPTVSDLCTRYLEEHAKVHKSEKSYNNDEQKIRDYVKPKMGSRPVSDITREDIASLHHKLRATPTQANRVLALLSKMFNLAEDWGLRPPGTNPTRRVKRYREEKRERYLSTAELAMLGRALADLEGKEPALALLAVRLLLLTGARLGEILTLQWAHVDFERGLLRLPESKTGQKTIPLSAPAVALLRNAPRSGDWVIPSKGNPGAHLRDLKGPWHRIKRRVETLQDELQEKGELKKKDRVDLSDLRLHDLRHSFASVGAGAGLSLPLIGALLGHSQAQTTQRYAHLAADPLHQAADTIAGHIAAVMEGRELAEVVQLRDSNS